MDTHHIDNQSKQQTARLRSLQMIVTVFFSFSSFPSWITLDLDHWCFKFFCSETLQSYLTASLKISFQAKNDQL